MSLLIAGAFILSVLGIIGSIAPGLPGAPLNLLALVLFELNEPGRDISTTILVVFSILTIASVFFDYIFPSLTAKKFGASNYGAWGAFIGLFAGGFILPPFGFFVGMFLGAVIGELMAGKSQAVSLRAGVASFVGSMVAITFKLLLSLAMTVYLVVSLF